MSDTQPKTVAINGIDSWASALSLRHVGHPNLSRSFNKHTAITCIASLLPNS